MKTLSTQTRDRKGLLTAYGFVDGGTETRAKDNTKITLHRPEDTENYILTGMYDGRKVGVDAGKSLEKARMLVSKYLRGEVK